MGYIASTRGIYTMMVSWTLAYVSLNIEMNELLFSGSMESITLFDDFCFPNAEDQIYMLSKYPVT